MLTSIPIATLFIGINGLIALMLSYLATMERVKTRIWHGETKEDVATQPNYLEKPNPWAAFVENYTQKSLAATTEAGVLQRKIRAFGNFSEYVPHALLFIVALELMPSPNWLLWFLGSAITVARIAHAWGLIATYGPSIGRAIGFFLTWLVYIVGANACIYYGIRGAIL